MKDILLWLFALESIGVAAFPITFIFLRCLPDRGYSVAKVLGLLLLAYCLWIVGLTHILPNTQASVIGLLLLLAAISAAIVTRRRNEIITHVRDHWRFMLFVDALFAAAFLAAIFYYSNIPGIGEGEEPMDFAFLNGILRSRFFPPNDPWLSGHSITYYYFGHFNVATVVKLLGTTPGVAFNLGLALVVGLTAIACFGIVFNLVAAGGRLGRAVVFGVVGALTLLFLSNLTGLFELMAAHGVGNEKFYQLVDINGLDGPRTTTAWYPTEWWWFGRDVSIASPWDFREFPFASVMFGGLHAHFLVLPFMLLATAIAFNFLRSDAPLGGRFWLANPWSLLLAALALGAIAFTDSWAAPGFVFITVAMVALRNCLAGPTTPREWLVRTTTFVLPLLILYLFLYLPHYAAFRPGVSGVFPLEATASMTWLPLDATVTRPHHFTINYLPLIWLNGSFLLAALTLTRGNGTRGPWAWLALAPAFVPLGLWALMVVIRRTPAGLGEEITTREDAWITWFVLTSVVTLACLALLFHAPAVTERGERSGLLFALTAAGTGFLLLLGTELFWIKDDWGTRTNTIFRLGGQAWVLLAIGGAFGLHYLTSRWRDWKGTATLGRLGWMAATFIVIGGALVYPITSLSARTNAFTNQRGLDGLAGIPATEHEAIEWLRHNVEGTPVILEAVGDEYSDYGRISASTGLPTVVGWQEKHERLWRGSWEPLGGAVQTQQGCPSARCLDVERIYTTSDIDEARAVLEQYEVEYVYVGRRERARYGDEGLAKFATFMEVAYRNEEVIIYRVPR
jgi:YYY domain-containing protein